VEWQWQYLVVAVSVCESGSGGRLALRVVVAVVAVGIAVYKVVASVSHNGSKHIFTYTPHITEPTNTQLSATTQKAPVVVVVGVVVAG